MSMAAGAVVAAVAAAYLPHRTPGLGFCQICGRETPHLGMRCAYTSSHHYITGYFEPPDEQGWFTVGGVRFRYPKGESS
jgi:hypothetical protein